MTENRRAETIGEPVDVALLGRQLAERGFYVIGELRCGPAARTGERIRPTEARTRPPTSISEA